MNKHKNYSPHYKILNDLIQMVPHPQQIQKGRVSYTGRHRCRLLELFTLESQHQENSLFTYSLT